MSSIALMLPFKQETAKNWTLRWIQKLCVDMNLGPEFSLVQTRQCCKCDATNPHQVLSHARSAMQNACTGLSYKFSDRLTCCWRWRKSGTDSDGAQHPSYIEHATPIFIAWKIWMKLQAARKVEWIQFQCHQTKARRADCRVFVDASPNNFYGKSEESTEEWR